MGERFGGAEVVTVEAAGKQKSAARFFADILRGAAIGVAFIIPGFSGGSVAAILGIYDALIVAVSDLFKHFRASMRKRTN